MLQWQSVTISDAGKIRQVNEDSLYANDAEMIWAVADVMGGHERGDYASQRVVEHLGRYENSRRTGVTMRQIELLLSDANKDLVNKAKEVDANVIASTAAVLCARSDSLICSWVGDSRIYRFRNGSLLRLTRDHTYETLLQDMSDRGADTSKILVDSQALTRGVGAENTLNTEQARYTSIAGDRYLICTDGLYKEVDEHQIEQYFAQLPNDKELLDQLHETYLTNGARDNLGMVVVSVSSG